jgi:predicted nucleic acid-binding protein
MTYLLDVSALLACLWQTHVFHQRACAWLAGKKLAVCPITEFGFLRISSLTSVNGPSHGLHHWSRPRSGTRFAL